jgi:RNA polymerase sigma-70 factor, ECF subfamily
VKDRPGVTQCLNRMKDGDQAAARELGALVYDDLKERAEAFVRGRTPGGIGATTLVHEAYLKLVDGAAIKAGGREHFMALASKIMRDLLVDLARRNAAKKRGGEMRRITLSTGGPAEETDRIDVLAVHEALVELAKLDPRMAQIVEMRYFGGMVGDEIAEHLGVSRRTVVRELSLAQAWLRKALAEHVDLENDSGRP